MAEGSTPGETPAQGPGSCNCGCNGSLWGVTATIISLIALCLAVAAIIVVTSGHGDCRIGHDHFYQPYAYAQPGGLDGGQNGPGGASTGGPLGLSGGGSGASSGLGGVGKATPQRPQLPQSQPQVAPRYP